MKAKGFAILALGIVLGIGGTFLLDRLFGPAAQAEDAGQATGGAPAAAAKAERKILYWRAPMDPTEIYDAPGESLMGMELIPVYEGDEAGGAGSISIDGRVRQNMNLRTAPVEKRDLARTVRAHGKVTFAQDREFALNARIHGWVEKLYIDTLGQKVAAGDPLAAVYSPELMTTEKELLLALRNRDELAPNAAERIRESADRLVQAGRTRLELWDVPREEIERLTATKNVERTIVLKSRFSGVVTRKSLIEGAEIKPGMELFRIADLGQVWIEASLYESELSLVREGGTAEITLDQVPGVRLTGRIALVYPYLDGPSRANTVRIVVPNAGLRLKPEMYATVILRGAEARGALAVPSEAVIDSGLEKIVFATRGDGVFEPRQVRTGLESSDGYTEIVSGLLAGEQVVVSGQFLLDSESRTREAIAKMRAASSGAKEPGK